MFSLFLSKLCRCDQREWSVSKSSSDTIRVKPGEAFALTRCPTHVCLLATQSAVLPLEAWRRAHTPQATLATSQKVGGEPELESNPPCVYKMSLCTKTSSHTQTCLNFRGVCSWGDDIWQAYRKSISDEAWSRCEIVIQVGQTVRSPVMDSQRTISGYVLHYLEHETHLRVSSFFIGLPVWGHFCCSDGICRVWRFLPIDRTRL